MSLWYVFAAIGIQPASIICPNYPVWLISSPVFTRSTLNLGGGKTFVIKAPKASAQNKYIQSATLNGESWNKPWLSQEQLEKGGILVLNLGPEPNRNWGNQPAAAPPSFTR
jgi:putative alpha-1,2-mannosidase